MMRPGYRLAQCPCGRLFPTLKRAPAWHCSLQCAERAFQPWWVVA